MTFKSFLSGIVIASMLTLSATAAPLLGISYPPLANEEQMNLSLDALADLDIRHVRYDAKWAFREKEQGKYNWAPLTARLERLNKENVNVLLTIEPEAPDWTCDRGTDCTIYESMHVLDFAEQLINRFGDKLDAIQLGNEWDAHKNLNLEEFVNLQNQFFALVKQQHPNIRVVLGGMTSGPFIYETICIEKKHLNLTGMQFRDASISPKAIHHEICTRNRERFAHQNQLVKNVLASSRFDIADIHLYDLAGHFADVIELLKRNTDHPIWATEFGGPNPRFELSSPSYQAERLEVYMDVVAKLPIQRAYYFKLTDDPTSYHNLSGLFDVKGNAKPAFEVFKLTRTGFR